MMFRLSVPIGVVLGLAAAAPGTAATQVVDLSAGSSEVGYTGSAGYSRSASGDAAILTAAIAPSSAAQVQSGTLFTTFGISGDFVAQVDVAIGGLPVISAARYIDADFLATLADGTILDLSAVHDAPAYVAASQTVAGTYMLDGTGAATLDITLRIARAGDTFTESYAARGSGDFTQLASLGDPGATGPTSFALVGFYNGSAGANGSATFSNFTITTPAAAPVPEPATWASMVAGLGFVGARRRGRRGQARPA